jgi:Ca2+-binding EF-hand superfamily protein
MAQEEGRPGGGRGPGRGRFGPNIGFAALDTNNDGALDADEITAAPKVLAKLDKNGDGKITSDEARPAMEGRGGEGGAPNTVEETVKTLMAFDANGDGKLTRDELPERMRGLFDRADENKDGFVTADEIRKLAAAQAAPANPEPRREMNFIRMDPILAAIDTNHDGVISADELAHAAQSIRVLDKNGDGRVTRDEATPAMGRGRPQ